MGGGDLNALVGLAGFVIGILIGIVFLKRGFGLKRSYPAKLVEGTTLPVVMFVLLVLVLAVPAIFHASEAGPRLYARPCHRLPRSLLWWWAPWLRSSPACAWWAASRDPILLKDQPTCCGAPYCHLRYWFSSAIWRMGNFTAAAS
ncbi:MAG: hypothetical protein ACLU38_09245 [Dysosmobacter sp.]